MTATIIAFPTPAPARAPLAAETPQQRVARAVAGLEAALAAQRQAVAEWRESLETLRGSVQGLGQSLTGLQDRLGDAAVQVAGVGEQARDLEAWADCVLARPAR